VLSIVVNSIVADPDGAVMLKVLLMLMALLTLTAAAVYKAAT